MTNILPRTNLLYPSPCPHCQKDNRNKWCYEYPSEEGDLYGVCKRESPPADGWEETPWQDAEGTKKYALKKEEKRIRPKARRAWNYVGRDGKALVRFVREDDGAGKREHQQQHWDKGARSYKPGIKGKVAPEDIPIYNYPKVRKAIAAGETIFIVEGEPCCDALEKIGLVATTNLGGSLKWQQHHSKDLEGASLVLVPDRDQKGIKHMQRIAADFPDARWLYPKPQSDRWRNVPKDNGVDVADWISDGATVDDLMNAIGVIPDIKFAPDPNEKKEAKPEEIKVPRLPARPDLSRAEVLGVIDDAIHSGQEGSELAATINDLSKKSSYQSRELWRLHGERSSEIEKAETREARKAEVNNLLEFSKARLDIADYLHPYLATPLAKLGSLLNLDPAAMLVTLLPTAASLLPLGNQLELIRATRFYAQPILYTGVVAESASMKTPAQKTILRPLFRLQHEAEDNYRHAMRAWGQAKSENGGKTDEPEPMPREYYTTDVTAEAIASIQCAQPDRGFLIYRDELAGLLKDSNAYRAGKGSDTEKLLSARDGTGIKINRASGKRTAVKQSGFSITGGIQPDVLRRQMGNLDDSNGYWARFIWLRMAVCPSPYPEEECDIDLDELLYSLYKRLASIEPQTFVLSSNARRIYKQFYNFLDSQRMAEPRQGLRAVFGKFKSVTGELALLLHVINAAAEGDEIPPQVSEATMQGAIGLAKHFLSQTKLLYAEEDVQTGQTEPIYAHLIEISKQKGWLSARTAQRSSHSLKKLSPDEVRSHFREMEAMGFGRTRHEGKKLEWHFEGENAPRESVLQDIDRAINATSKPKATIAESEQKSEVCHRIVPNLSPFVTGGGDKISEAETVTRREVPGSSDPFVTVVTGTSIEEENEEVEIERRYTTKSKYFSRDLYEIKCFDFLRIGASSLGELRAEMEKQEASVFASNLDFLRSEIERLHKPEELKAFYPGKEIPDLDIDEVFELFGSCVIETHKTKVFIAKNRIQRLEKLGWTKDTAYLERQDRFSKDSEEEMNTAQLNRWIAFLDEEIDSREQKLAAEKEKLAALPALRPGVAVRYIGNDPAKAKAFAAAISSKKRRAAPKISRIGEDGAIEIKSSLWGETLMLVKAEEVAPV